MENLRLKLEDRFDEVPGEVTVVVHTNPVWLTMAHPFLPAARWSAAPAGRRYLAGWAMATELHVLNDPYLEKRAAGDDSLEALRGTAERLYAQLVVAANNPALPPSWTPRRFARYLRWAWLVEGGAQYFARQVGLYRPAVIRRLRESSRPSFPPSRRDAVILGGTIFDLLENERGPEACERLVDGLLPGGPAVTLEDAFDARFRDIEERLARLPALDEPPGRRQLSRFSRGSAIQGQASSSSPTRVSARDGSRRGELCAAWTRTRCAAAAEARVETAETKLQAAQPGRLQQAGDAGVLEQPLQHLGLNRILGESNVGQIPVRHKRPLR